MATQAYSEQAAVSFDDLATVPEKMQLVHRAVRRHAKNLIAAHVNVVNVAAGYRARRSVDGIQELHPEPCVVLVVSEKWTGEEPDASRDRLPRRLPLAVKSKGAPRDYAVPTDVQPRSWGEEAVAHFANGIDVQKGSNPDGAIACTVRLDGAGPPTWFALSALHVFSPFPELDGAPSPAVIYTPIGSATPREPSTSWGGCLRSNGPSFDVQLAQIEKSWFNHTFQGLKLGTRPYLRSAAELDAIAHTSRFRVLVPDNHINHTGQARPLVLTQFVRYGNMDDTLNYGVTKNGTTFSRQIGHRELIILDVAAGDDPSEPGDSGSAVVATRLGQTVLVGMLIGGPAPGSTDTRMYVLPAWEMFKLPNWKNNLPPGTTRITPAFSI
jgi:hypothetical protein